MIPKGWRRTTIGDCLIDSTIRNTGKKLSHDDLRSVNKTLGMIPMKDRVKGASVERAKIVRNGWFAYNPMRINVGSICRWDKGYECIVSPDYVVFECDEKSILGDYFDHFRMSHRWEKFMEDAGRGSVRVRIYLDDLKQLECILPPLDEQRRIAEILSTWDRAIEATEKLIANSEAQKKALMQQLLTGKKRLPGFKGEWTSTQLDKLFTFKKGQGISKQDVCENGVYPCVLYGELYTHYGEVIDRVLSRTNSDEGVPSLEGDLLVPASTTTTGIDLANVTVINQSDVKLGGDINILRMKNTKIYAAFFAYYLTHIKKHKIASRAQGITIIHLYTNHLKDIEVQLPSFAEQEKIADVILKAAQEINAQEEYLLKLNAEKSALMQQLLTGKRRVKLESNQEVAA